LSGAQEDGTPLPLCGPWSRAVFALFAVACVLYGIDGLMAGDGGVPATPSRRVQYHGAAALALFPAFLCVAGWALAWGWRTRDPVTGAVSHARLRARLLAGAAASWLFAVAVDLANR